MIDWNLGDILDAIEPVMPKDAPALIHGDRIVTWPEMSRRSNNLARNLRERGAGSGAKVAFYMRNRPEYGELIAACFKGRLVHRPWLIARKLVQTRWSRLRHGLNTSGRRLL